MVQPFRPKNIPAPSPKRLAWVGWVLFRAVCKSRVDFGFVPIQARADFHGLGQAAQFHVPVNGRATTPAQFGLKVGEGEIAHISVPSLGCATLSGTTCAPVGCGARWVTAKIGDSGLTVPLFSMAVPLSLDRVLCPKPFTRAVSRSFIHADFWNQSFHEVKPFFA